MKGKQGNLRETGLETERLLMRRGVSGQAQAWWTIFGDPEVTRLTSGAPPPDLAYSQRVLERTIRRPAREQPLGWWAVVEGARDAIIGTMGLNATPEEGTAELGYHFRWAAWGKGYATEAACAVVAYGFGLGGCKRIIARLHPANGASRRVLTKSGFHQRGAVAANGNHEEHFELAPHDVRDPP